jgi:two-component system repressor protein LuxO
MASAETGSSVSRVLLVDRDPVFRRFVREQVAPKAGFPIDIVESECWSAVDAADSATCDLIVLAAENTGAGSADDQIAELRDAAVRAPVIVVSNSGSLSLAVSAMRAGASDFLVRPTRVEALCDSIQRAIAKNSPVKGTNSARPADFERFIGRSEAMRGVFEMISRVAGSKAPVFVTGESGTGKELTAEAIHTRSGRPGGFVALNCGAIPRDLMESEIFGHVRGAFTGANDDRAGAAELADGGTLFLDEICEMAPDLQTKLLRFIQTGTLRRVGDTQLRPVDVRFVCATNRNPEAEVAAGRFRADLYYRLHVLPVHLPPLRERPDDILPIAEAALLTYAEEEDRGFGGFDGDARGLLMGYEWPGNVRQLQNVIRRVVVMNDGAAVTAPMLAMGLAQAGQPGSEIAIEPVTENPPERRLVGVEPFHLQERRIIEHALTTFGGNVVQAAAALQISASTIYRKKQGWGGNSNAA